MDILTRLIQIGIGICLLCSTPAKADCYDYAAAYHQVNPWILRAIVDHESKGNPNAIRKNSDGSIDRGAAQINSVHLAELARYGIGPNELMNECVSINVGAWLLRKRILEYGNTCRAIGSYHSKTPEKRDAYIAEIQRTLRKWNIVINCVGIATSSRSTNTNQR